MKPISAEAALGRAAALCSRGEQAERDIYDKLIKWGIGETDATSIIKRLKDEGFLNEERYALAFAHDKFRFNGWGRIKIAYMLRQKGVSSQYITLAVNSIGDDECRETLTKLLRARWREVSGRDSANARAALLRHGASRGFEPELLYSCVDMIMKDGKD